MFVLAGTLTPMHRRAFLASTAGLAVAPNPAWLQFPASSGDPAFDGWLRDFTDRAVAAGWSRSALAEIFAGLSPDASVVAADHRQPELSKPMGDYLSGIVSESRIGAGRNRRKDMGGWLGRMTERTGVPAEIVVAIWGVESNFGQNQGSSDVIRSLATLAADGRRRQWAEEQLLSALKILTSGEARRDQLTGSWAGAMGQTQFTPQDYLAWAVDEDDDGRRDIWRSAYDALGSAANFLARKAAWRRGKSWAREVALPPGFDYSLAEGARQTPTEWGVLGVRTADRLAWSAADLMEPTQLILPQGWSAPAFLVFPNHMAIRTYNNSTAYALAVGLYADRIGGAPALVQSWPQDQPISYADRMAAQSALAKLGFDPGEPDGIIGLKTRAAARAWQKARGFPADGYLSYGLIQELKAQAG